MPTSKLDTWPAVLRLVAECQPRRVLDIGPGCGKAGILLREYVGTASLGTGPIERIDALEAEPRYVDRFPWLTRVYDNLHMPCDDGPTASFFADYDLVLLIDVIEHMTVDAARRLLAQVPGHVIISTPMDWFQNPEAEHWPTERHRSHWTFDKLNRLRSIDRHCADNAEHCGMLIVRCSPINKSRGAA